MVAQASSTLSSNGSRWPGQTIAGCRERHVATDALAEVGSGRSMEIRNMSRRVTGRADDLEIVEQKPPIAHRARLGDRSRHGLAEKTLEKDEHAELGDLVAEPAPSPPHRDAARQLRVVSRMVEDSRRRRTHTIESLTNLTWVGIAAPFTKDECFPSTKLNGKQARRSSQHPSPDGAGAPPAPASRAAFRRQLA